jgi:hypothetical protein
MSDVYGGGIFISDTSPTVTIASCTFHECSASSGGGLDYSGSNLTLSQCCFRGTSSVNRGTAISFSDGSSSIDCRQITLSECHDVDGFASGTVRVSSAFNCDYHLLNFSFCALRYSSDSSGGDGCVLEVSDTNGNWNFSSCTVVRCIGLSGIQNRCTSLCCVQLCNFYGNAFSEFSGVLSCERTGLLVEFCIFEANTNEIILVDAVGESGFIISNSVFSSSLPSGPYYLSTGDVFVNTRATTRYFEYLDTTLCPGAPDLPSPTSVFTSVSRQCSTNWQIFRGLLFDFAFIF